MLSNTDILPQDTNMLLSAASWPLTRGAHRGVFYACSEIVVEMMSLNANMLSNMNMLLSERLYAFHIYIYIYKYIYYISYIVYMYTYRYIHCVNIYIYIHIYIFIDLFVCAFILGFGLAGMHQRSAKAERQAGAKTFVF